MRHREAGQKATTPEIRFLQNEKSGNPPGSSFVSAGEEELVKRGLTDIAGQDDETLDSRSAP